MGDPVAAETTDDPAEPLLRDVDDLDVTDPSSVLETMAEAAEALAEGFLARLPLVVLAVVLLVVGLVVVRFVVRWTEHGLERSRIDHAVSHLVVNLLRVALVVLVLLFSLSIAGVQVGAALAGLGLAGLALAFALQNILENFVAGILILMRRPFTRGDQIETNDYAGIVEDINLRVTRVRVFDGEVVLIPNAMVFTEPIVNLTHRGHRRTRVVVGIDYRDDHDRAREVLLEAVCSVEGVRRQPEPEVLCIELGESSVDFEVAYWTGAAMYDVRQVRDRVLRACKSAVEAAGMTIPWPIRTLEWGASELPVGHTERDPEPS